jgi:hypothetical protein
MNTFSLPLSQGYKRLTTLQALLFKRKHIVGLGKKGEATKEKLSYFGARFALGLGASLLALARAAG